MFLNKWNGGSTILEAVEIHPYIIPYNILITKEKAALLSRGYFKKMITQLYTSSLTNIILYRLQFTSPTSEAIPLVNGYLTGQHGAY